MALRPSCFERGMQFIPMLFYPWWTTTIRTTAAATTTTTATNTTTATASLLPLRDVYGNGIPNGTGNTMGIPWEWE